MLPLPQRRHRRQQSPPTPQQGACLAGKLAALSPLGWRVYQAGESPVCASLTSALAFLAEPSTAEEGSPKLGSRPLARLLAYLYSQSSQSAFPNVPSIILFHELTRSIWYERL